MPLITPLSLTFTIAQPHQTVKHVHLLVISEKKETLAAGSCEGVSLAILSAAFKRIPVMAQASHFPKSFDVPVTASMVAELIPRDDEARRCGEGKSGVKRFISNLSTL